MRVASIQEMEGNRMFNSRNWSHVVGTLKEKENPERATFRKKWRQRDFRDLGVQRRDPNS